MIEITYELKKQIVAYAKHITDATSVTLHKFANKPGYMLAVETVDFEGFESFLLWMQTEVERDDIDVIRTLPEEHVTTAKDLLSVGCLQNAFEKFGIAFPANDGRLTKLEMDNEGGETYAI